jgi:hypothetical protein
MNSDKTYNGWTNYETWSVALWIDNNQGSYSLSRSIAQDAWDEAKADRILTREERARYDLSEALKNWIEEGSPLDDASLYSDLLSTALSEVNWDEIASHYLDEIDQDEDEDDEDD